MKNSGPKSLGDGPQRAHVDAPGGESLDGQGAQSNSTPYAPAKGDLAKLAHELRTPLCAIAAASEIMKDERLGPVGNTRYQEYASDIHESVQFALSMIDRMAVSHLGAGQAEETYGAPVRVAAVVQRIVSALQPLAENHGVSLVADSPEDARQLCLLGDEVSIKQIVLNLVSNALKFTKPGGDIKVSTVLNGDKSFSILVEDTGIGIAVDAFERALNGHGRGEPNSRPHQGQGLGLPLVKELSEANGARVFLSETSLPGTTVEVCFHPSRVVFES